LFSKYTALLNLYDEEVNIYKYVDVEMDCNVLDKFQNHKSQYKETFGESQTRFKMQHATRDKETEYVQPH